MTSEHEIEQSPLILDAEQGANVQVATDQRTQPEGTQYVGYPTIQYQYFGHLGDCQRILQYSACSSYPSPYPTSDVVIDNEVYMPPNTDPSYFLAASAPPLNPPDDVGEANTKTRTSKKTAEKKRKRKIELANEEAFDAECERVVGGVLVLHRVVLSIAVIECIVVSLCIPSMVQWAGASLTASIMCFALIVITTVGCITTLVCSIILNPADATIARKMSVDEPEATVVVGFITATWVTTVMSLMVVIATTDAGLIFLSIAIVLVEFAPVFIVSVVTTCAVYFPERIISRECVLDESGESRKTKLHSLLINLWSMVS